MSCVFLSDLKFWDSWGCHCQMCVRGFRCQMCVGGFVVRCVLGGVVVRCVLGGFVVRCVLQGLLSDVCVRCLWPWTRPCQGNIHSPFSPERFTAGQCGCVLIENCRHLAYGKSWSSHSTVVSKIILGTCECSDPFFKEVL